MPATLTPPQGTPAVNPSTPVANVAELLGGIVGDVQTLVRQQAQMLRAEIKEDFRRGRTATIYIGTGLMLAAVGTLFLMVGVVYLLNYLAPSLPPFACWLIVGGLLVAGGLAAAYAGKTIFEKHNPLPDKTFNALTENLTWQTTPSPK